MVFLLSEALKERRFTKRDAFVLMDCDSPEYTDTPQVSCSFHLWKKTRFSMEFAEEWLRYAQDERIISDAPNRCGLQNYPDFHEHRHDQSIFSLLTKKHRLFPHRLACQYGLKAVGEERFSGDQYPQITFHHREATHWRELVRQAYLACRASWAEYRYEFVRSLRPSHRIGKARPKK